jgi:hypothetical protein
MQGGASVAQGTVEVGMSYGRQGLAALWKTGANAAHRLSWAYCPSLQAVMPGGETDAAVFRAYGKRVLGRRWPR